MIALVRGTLIDIKKNRVIVDAGGVGYEVHVTPGTAQALGAPGSPVMLRTHMNVKDDALELYGFLDADHLELFKLLLGVPRVGPGVALKVLAGIEPAALVSAILAKDPEPLKAISGVGEETAGRIVGDLSRKIKKLDLAWTQSAATARAVGPAPVALQAREALSALGYGSAEIEKSLVFALGKAGGEARLEDVVRQALGYFARQTRE